MGSSSEPRNHWLEMMRRVAGPVLEAAAARELKRRMPVEAKGDRSAFTHLEAVGRTLAGVAPWLACTGLEGTEADWQARFADDARMAIDAITDPDSPDYCRFGSAEPFTQTLVDAAFLALAVIRAPDALWIRLAERTKANLTAALLETRQIRPPYCNWLLFSAVIEAALLRMTGSCDPVRIDYAIRQHEAWYQGDGTYGDGPEFHWDYYNSYVIQPMLIELAATAGSMYTELDYSFGDLSSRFLRRARRHAAVLERLIAPDGTFPALGRSIAYRTGAFHLLAQLAWKRSLPEELAPQQVRCALQAAMDKCLGRAGNYDEGGWLRIGLCGSQPSLGEGYISTGSLYLCTAVFLPLGLPADHVFWTGEDRPWTSRRIWSGEDMEADRALQE